MSTRRQESYYAYVMLKNSYISAHKMLKMGHNPISIKRKSKTFETHSLFEIDRYLK